MIISFLVMGELQKALKLVRFACCAFILCPQCVSHWKEQSLISELQMQLCKMLPALLSDSDDYFIRLFNGANFLPPPRL